MRYTNVFLALITLSVMSSCAPKRIATPDGREIIETDRYSYMKDHEGRFYVLTSTPQALKEAITKIKPGPASVDRMDVWVITPLRKE